MATIHPLTHTWTFWEIKQGANEKNYGNNVRQLGDFNSVERFWDYWLSMPPPSEIFGDGSKKILVDGRETKALGMFKKNITPEWEDPANRDGSQLDASKALTLEALDIHWENLVMGFIGEIVDEDDVICGARLVYQNRKSRVHYKFEVWLRRKDEDVAAKIKAKLCDILNDDRVKGQHRLLAEDFNLEKRK